MKMDLSFCEDAMLKVFLYHPILPVRLLLVVCRIILAETPSILQSCGSSAHAIKNHYIPDLRLMNHPRVNFQSDVKSEICLAGFCEHDQLIIKSSIKLVKI